MIEVQQDAFLTKMQDLKTLFASIGSRLIDTILPEGSALPVSEVLLSLFPIQQSFCFQLGSGWFALHSTNIVFFTV